jgi:hypothetical protein
MQKHRPAGQRKRVDLLLVDDLEAVTELVVLVLLWYCTHEIAADAFDVLVDPPIVQQWQLTPDFSRCFLPDLDILRGRVLVLVRRDLRLRRSGDRDGQQQRREDVAIQMSQRACVHTGGAAKVAPPRQGKRAGR